MTDRTALQLVLQNRAGEIPHDLYRSLIQREMIKHIAHCGLVATAWGLESTGLDC